MRSLVPPLLAALLLGGCGDATTNAESASEGTLTGTIGADYVDCRTPGEAGANLQDVYGEGATADSPEQALEVARSERAFGGVQDDLSVEVEEEDRVLYVVEVDGVVKQAVILRDGPATEGAGGPGWYVESWAHCDYSELPPSFTDSIGLTVWTDADGAAAPTTEIQSWVGPAHCDWQSMTFLHVGEDAVFVRAPQPELEDFFASRFQTDVVVPKDATDTGFMTGEDHLWLAADEQVAYVGSARRAEAWPRTVEHLGCA